MVRVCDIWHCLYPYAVFRTGKAVYLTFDDGPIPEVTPKVLDILARYNVKATFFMVGENIDKHPEVFAQVIAAGHAVGNHTYNHLKGWKYATPEYLSNIARWEEAYKRSVTAAGGTATKRTLFRPPYGKATLAQRRALHRQGYRLIYWDILTRDYDAGVTTEQIVRKIKRQVRPGSIINFHDSLKSNERMLRALPQVIEWLQGEGYQIERLDD